MDKNLILVVDDDRGTRLIMRKALEQSGFDIMEAENGREALDAFEASQPDLVLLDVSMPQMNGFEVCRRLRTHPTGVTVPIVIITVKDDFDAIAEAYDSGATDFIAKPINRIILRERVRYMLRANATARQLHQSQELLARAQSAACLGSFLYEPNSLNLKVSEEFRNIFGLSHGHQTVAWNAVWQKIHPDDRKALEPVLRKAQTIGAHFRQDIRLLNGSEGDRFVMLQLDSETDSEGKAVVRIIGIAQDITERKLSELLEKDQNDILKRIARKEPLEEIFLEAARLVERQRPQSMCAICRVEEERIRMISAPSLTSRFRHAIIDTVLSTEHGTCAAAAYLGQPVVTDNIATSSYWKKRRSLASDHGIRSSASVPIFSGTGQVLGTVGLMRRDIYHTTNADLELMERIASLVALAIEQHHLSQRLIYQAQHDPLTGLVNREALAHWLSKILKQFARVPAMGAYLLIDLDRFKRINDLLGHHVGDLLLQEVAERLRQCVRESDILSRIGGDEFVLVMPAQRDKNDSVRVASRILDAFNSTFAIEGQNLHVEASIGITLFPQDGMDGTSLHKNADIAMYVAKNQGGNQFHFFDSKMQEAVVQRLQIENDLRKAFERNEFELHYQPQLNLTSNRLVVMEALIRWNHPERGRIPADRFIRVAEESRLIIPIGRWVLKEACRQNMAWQQQGLPPVRMAVNASVVQFTEKDFIKNVREALEETGLDPRWLEIEITETVVLNDLEKACENLQELKELGVTTTLDDFGTGYSSITYLRQMPLDGIKIDQSFIRDMEIAPTHNESRNINFVKAFVDLARNLHLLLVAEGIETEDQSNLLKTLGCTIGQGFLFSAPLPASEASAFLARTSGILDDEAAAG